MQKQTFEGRAPGFLAAAWIYAAAVLISAFMLLSPARALADDATVVAHSVDATTGAQTNYTSINDAISAGYSGKTIVMDVDWVTGVGGVFSNTGIEVADSKKLTIDMNGHRITNGVAAATITLKENSELTLTSSSKATFEYEGYNSDTGNKQTYKVTSGGLVNYNPKTNYVSNDACISVEYQAKLTLDGVAIAGGNGKDGSTSGQDAGGVTLAKCTSLFMKNGAVIEHCRTDKSGGGVYAQGDGISITMENAAIKNNYAAKIGGGIYIVGDKTTVTMKNSSIQGNFSKEGGGGIFGGSNFHVYMSAGSKIADNVSSAGGGLYFGGTKFYIESSDGEAFISNNKATASSRTTAKGNQSGGGIHIAQSELTQNEGLIKNITIRNNYSAYDGGGLELDQEWTRVVGCTITGNTAYYEGGGAYVCNDDNSFEDCTITGNACNLSGNNYEGGGVYVWCDYDVKLSGKCLIYGNTRGQNTGNADDIFLRENVGATAKAYVTGSLSQGSHVGIRTGITGDRRVALEFKPQSKDCLFADLGGYYVSYGSDKGGDAWQRHASKQFLLQVNSQGSNRYYYGSAVTVTAPAVEDKLFWFWSSSEAVGLYPVDDYINDTNRYSPALSFTMPQNEVRLTAVYADIVDSVVIYGFKAPATGEDLPTTAKLTRSDGKRNGANNENSVAITWYELGADGSKTAVAGKAKAGTSYVASFSAAQSNKYGCYFNSSINANSVTVSATEDGQGGEKAVSASVDTATGSLAAESAIFKTGGEASEQAAGTVTVELENGGLSAGSGAAAASSLKAMGADEESSNSLGKVEVSYTEDSDSVTVNAPSCEGYNFCYWSDAPEGVELDSEVGTATFDAADFKEALKLGAVYTPVVTSVDLGMGAPVAGEALAKEVTSIMATCSDGQVIELLDAFTDEGSLPVSWSPSASGKAACSTAYAAAAALDDGEGYVGVEDVISPSATVSANGTAVEGATAGFTVVDGKLALCAAFPATADEAAVDKDAAEAVKGKAITVKANKKTKKTAKAKTVAIKAPKSASGTKASFKVVSKAKLIKVNAKTGKVTLKKGATKGKTYKAKVKVAYGYSSKTVTVKFKVK